MLLVYGAVRYYDVFLPYLFTFSSKPNKVSELSPQIVAPPPAAKPIEPTAEIVPPVEPAAQNQVEARDTENRDFAGVPPAGMLASQPPPPPIESAVEPQVIEISAKNGETSPRVEAIASTFSGANFESRLSKAILQEMWEKWVLIATMAGSNCLMRAAVGDIVAAGAESLSLALLDECASIATARSFPPSAATMTRNRTMLTTAGSTFAASMLRDIERGAPIEADHIVGDLIRRGAGGPRDYPLLRIAYAHLQAYEARRKRENAGAPKP